MLRNLYRVGGMVDRELTHDLDDLRKKYDNPKHTVAPNYNFSSVFNPNLFVFPDHFFVLTGNCSVSQANYPFSLSQPQPYGHSKCRIAKRTIFLLRPDKDTIHVFWLGEVWLLSIFQESSTPQPYQPDQNCAIPIETKPSSPINNLSALTTTKPFPTTQTTSSTMSSNHSIELKMSPLQLLIFMLLQQRLN
ncbi:hypothetical protein YC2023_028609 [Brassica napus]